MQHIVNRFVSLIVLLLVITGSKAQSDSIVIVKTDTINGKYRIRAEKIKKDSAYFKKYATEFKRYPDSAYRRTMKTAHARQDSIHRIYKHKMRTFNDSVRIYKRYQDSTYRNVMRKALKRQDSIHRTYEHKMRKFSDSARVYKRYLDSNHRKIQFMTYNTMQDSMYKKQRFEVYRKMDSIKFKELKFRIVQDSMRMKIYKQQRDSVYKTLKKREVVMELPANEGKKIRINHYYQDIIVKTGDARKVKLYTMVYEDGKENLSDKEWFDKLKTSIQSTDEGIVVQANAAEKKGMTMSYSTNVPGTHVLTVQSKDTTKEEQYNMPRKVLRIEIPKDMAVTIVSRYSDVELGTDVNDLNINITNGKLRMHDATNVVINSSYGAVQAGYLTNADVHLTNGKFDCKGITTLKIDSKYSKVNFATAGKINMKSLSDRYELQQVNNLEGVKAFGQLNIQNLLTDMVLKGSSADVNVTNFGANAMLVKISNKYADVKLPVKTLSGYSMDFEVTNSRVLGRQDTLSGKLPPLNKGVFTASGGDLKGLHTKLQLDCNSCVVDLR